MSEKLLSEVVRRATRGIIIDITGVAGLDRETAMFLLQMVRAVLLLGADIVITGMTPAIARLCVDQDIDFSGVQTHQTLHDGIRYLRQHLDLRE